MPKITIKEIDETVAGLEGITTDIAYIPGFADTNGCVYIYDTVDGEPTENTKGSISAGKDFYSSISDSTFPCFACNIVTKRTWECTGIVEVSENEFTYVWTEKSAYMPPLPENVPILCETLQEFEEYFGKLPYKWKKGYVVSGGTALQESDAQLADRMKYPTFDDNPLQGDTSYTYREGDFEKSYIYARELLTAGMPVLFENIVERSEGDAEHRKELPSVQYFYGHLGDHFEEVADKGEYSVKYITSGAYPVFECTGAHSKTTTYTDGGQFVFSGEGSSVIAISTPQCAIGGGASEAVITAIYNAYKWVEYSGTPTSGTIVETEETTSDNFGNPHSYSPVYYNSTESLYWVSEVDAEAGQLQRTISVTTGNPYTQGSENSSQGGIGNTIALTATSIQVTFAAGEHAGWDWISATFTAHKTATEEESGYVLAQKMLSVAAQRGDAVALIDHTDNRARALTGPTSVYGAIAESAFTDGEFGAMFTPWASYTMINEGSAVPATQLMPASFAYLMSMARSIRTNPNWLAVAGVTRGLVPYIGTLDTVANLTNTIANSYQPRDDVSINAITNIKPYGLTIWGNRTLKKNVNDLTATSFLNTRNLVNEVKKVAYITAKSLIFEQNTDVLWINFRAGITPLLDKMMTGQGLSNYKIIKGTTTERAKVVATIKLFPVYAVEDFEITVIISDDNVSVS